AQFLDGTVERRSKVLLYHSFCLPPVFGDKEPHGCQRVREGLWVFSCRDEELLKLLPVLGEPLRSGVVTGGQPAISQARNPPQSRLRAPAPDPDCRTGLPCRDRLQTNALCIVI